MAGTIKKSIQVLEHTIFEKEGVPVEPQILEGPFKMKDFLQDVAKASQPAKADKK